MSAATSLRAHSDRALSRLVMRVPGGYRLARRAGWVPPEDRVRWFGARTVGEASRALATQAGRLLTTPDAWVLVVGEHRGLRRSLLRQLRRRGHPHRWYPTPDELVLGDGDAATLACIVSADVEAKKITALARHAVGDPRLAGRPLEYATGLEPEQRQFRRQDEYAGHEFISPVLLASPSPYELYEESLKRFEQKCGLRDYLDLYQMLESVVKRDVPGDIAEFGSYKGHSGWLIGRSLQALGSDKQVHLFDTFESFPSESTGVDYFWSGTHEVHFEEVQAKLAELPAVQLVRGEFERTLPGSGIDALALAFVDCDSYRAVRYVAESLFEDRLVPGGAMVFEDYGHPALLGCRVAIHEFFDARADCTRFFSQFSGLYIVVKQETG